MKKINYLLFAFFAFFTLTAGIMYHSGTPGGKTGSPGDGGSNCTQCHAGTPVTQSGWISTNIPVDGYIPGQTYTITFAGSHPGAQKYGFEMTSEDSNDAKKGEFTVTNATTTQLFNSNSITHTAGGNPPVNDGFEFSFDWTAPATGTGDVTFYAAVNAANGNGSTSGDVIYLTNHLVTEEIITGIGDVDQNELSFYPNPAVNFINFNLPAGTKATVNIYNTSGSLMKQEIVSEGDQVDVQNLSKGVYFISISSQGDVYKDKLIIK